MLVNNGNHSILSGILKEEGTIQANQTYDLVPTYDYMYFDSIYFRNKMNDEKLYKVRRFEIGALYEIPLLIFKTNGSGEREKIIEMLDKLVG